MLEERARRRLKPLAGRPWQRVLVASPTSSPFSQLVAGLFEEFMPLAGTGIHTVIRYGRPRATFAGRSVMVIGHAKG
jgi:acetyl-CoA carboxylase alpha subunit